ncbi:MAG: hypothetical protein JNL19_11680 [Burkholderiales bacterium]|nr:hypothetical protein [Burkholderiales bacterium]
MPRRPRCRSPRFALLSALRVALIAAALPLIAPLAAALAPSNPPKTTSAATITISGNEQLAHPVVSGRLGPWRRAELWLTQSNDVDDAPFRGRVVIAGTPATIHTLPPPDETGSNFMMKVRAVMFRQIGTSAERALIVLYSATQIGPQQTPYYGACVYRWNGNAFVRADAVEKQLAGARTAAEVTRRLASGGSAK